MQLLFVKFRCDQFFQFAAQMLPKFEKKLSDAEGNEGKQVHSNGDIIIIYWVTNNNHFFGEQFYWTSEASPITLSEPKNSDYWSADTWFYLHCRLMLLLRLFGHMLEVGYAHITLFGKS